MSALAWLLHEQGHSVSGSDCRETARTQELSSAGIPIHYGHDQDHLGSSQAVVYSSAITEDNVELQTARDLNIQVLHRQQLLAKIYNSHCSIGIAGTNGKTTTSAMVSTLLQHAGIDPSYLVGASTPNLGGFSRAGKGQWLVSEVDESDGYFVDLISNVGIVTNVGNDHLNYYGTIDALLDSFGQYVAQSEISILSADDPQSVQLASHAKRYFTFGIENPADLQATNIEQSKGCTRADLVFRGQPVGELEIPAPGRHNVMNALAALMAGHIAGVEFPTMLEGLKNFVLPNRRFQILEENGFVIVDDYAHMPEQIELNLEAARQGWNPERLIAVFQPHRYSRFSTMMDRFAQALSEADLVLITDIYPAFESPIPGIHSQSIVETMSHSHPNVHYLGSLGETHEFLSAHAVPGDFIIGFGAGDIWQVLHQLVRENGYEV
jgi:UDP-N-acetylmuramate--alanine ligase